MSQSAYNQSTTSTEAQILSAAEREFVAKGFAGARTAAIAEAAGVTHAMLHYYFRSKEKLFERILAEKISLLMEIIGHSNVGDDMSLESMIRNIIERHLDFLAANPDLPRLLIGEIYANPGHAAVFMDGLKTYAPDFIALLQAKIDTEAAQGLCRRVDARMLILDIASLNVFPFMAAPVVNVALGGCMKEVPGFIDERKKNNFDTIMRKLKP